MGTPTTTLNVPLEQSEHHAKEVLEELQHTSQEVGKFMPFFKAVRNIISDSLKKINIPAEFLV
jgi:hypothetical protein